jgi:hypothetical protein
VYDTWTGKLVDSIEGFHDAVNGISFSNQNDRTLLAVASGARRFSSMDDDEDVGSIPSGSLSNPPGSLSIYSI